MVELKVSGRLLTSFTIDARHIVLQEFADKISESATTAIHNGFNRNVQLASMVGTMADQEAVRAILRSLKVEIKSIDPLSLEAKFQDDLGHWYGGGEMPEDVSKLLQEIIDSSLVDWFRAEEPNKILVEVLNS